MDFLLHALVTLFVTLDPISLAPLFLALTGGAAKIERRQIAVRACIIAALVLIAFAVVGEQILAFLGISLPAFRIAGGLLLFAIAFEMVFEKRTDRKAATAEKVADRRSDLRDLAAFPLAIPLMSGPGAISATILLASQASGPLQQSVLVITILLLVGVCLAVFLLSGEIDHFIGETGRVVATRLLGVILAALSVQFVADGVITIARGTG
jgi:multiple antibiotic resistance protein